MDRRELLDRLRESRPGLGSQGVTDRRRFGCFARDDAGRIATSSLSRADAEQISVPEAMAG